MNITIDYDGKGFESKFLVPSGCAYTLTVGENHLCLRERNFVHLMETEIHIDIRYATRVLCQEYEYEKINRILALIASHYPRYADIVGEMIAIKCDTRPMEPQYGPPARERDRINFGRR